jgi:hypothetical protein
VELQDFAVQLQDSRAVPSPQAALRVLQYLRTFQQERRL